MIGRDGRDDPDHARTDCVGEALSSTRYRGRASLPFRPGSRSAIEADGKAYRGGRTSKTGRSFLWVQDPDKPGSWHKVGLPSRAGG